MVKNISIVIPTLNSGRTIDLCLKSINQQQYSGNIELIISDGGSTDRTLNIAKKYNAKIVENKLKTGESGKAIGIKKAKYSLVGLIDSDNILPGVNWLNNMVEPFTDNQIIGSEPWQFTYRQQDGIIDRYCALMGMNDPLCYFIGNYDHWNHIDKKWTRMNINQEDIGNWLKLTLNNPEIPTMGANGAIYRRDFLNKHFSSDYFFDIDFLTQAILKEKEVKYAKVKTGIVHLFSGSDFKKFYRKQHRRIRDMLSRRSINRIFISPDFNQRNYRWGGKSTIRFILMISKFILSCLLIVPLLIQTLRGLLNKRSNAWFIHPLICWLTLIAYAQGSVESLFIKSEVSRQKWNQ